VVSKAGENDWDDAAEDAWCLSVRPKVLEYLNRGGVVHGQVGDRPAWHIAPYVALWAIESPTRLGAVGWWVICGDLPTDCCSSHECRHPRVALRRIVDRWQDALAHCKPGDKTIGPTGISATLTGLLTRRVELLLDYANDDGLWPDDIYG
jgi:hypothetical protein